MTIAHESSAESTLALVLLVPSYEDWQSLHALLPLVDAALTTRSVHVRALIVDDGSTTRPPTDLVQAPLNAIRQVDVLSLRRNVGHQRAICVGLCHVASDPSLNQHAGVIVMDADGEDAPSDVARLVERFEASGCARAIFAGRMRRSEGTAFRVCYASYRALHMLLTGIPVRIGNFSVISMNMVRRLTVAPELWNHYAATAVQVRVPIEQLPTSRAHRLFGQSRMNFSALVSHGLSAMSVFSDRIGVRALVASLTLVVALALGIGTVVAVRLLTTLAIPGWATTAAGILAVLLMQGLLLSLVFAFLIHLGRSGGSFLPVRDYHWFVDRCVTVWSADDRV